jgi:hypothetical protein
MHSLLLVVIGTWQLSFYKLDTSSGIHSRVSQSHAQSTQHCSIASQP